MVVDHSNGLHEGVADCRAHEPKSALLEVFAHGQGLARFGRQILQALPRVLDRIPAHELPEVGVEASRRGPAQMIYAPDKAATVLAQIEEFLAGRRRRFDLQVDWRGMTDFQIAVRKAVMAVPYGKTASYGEIAAAVGKPQAPRAVGGVQASNPISFIIPCHQIGRAHV